jgi:hypothetical protein
MPSRELIYTDPKGARFYLGPQSKTSNVQKGIFIHRKHNCLQKMLMSSPRVTTTTLQNTKPNIQNSTVFLHIDN